MVRKNGFKTVKNICNLKVIETEGGGYIQSDL